MCLADVMSVGLLSDIRTVNCLIFTLLAQTATIMMQIEPLHCVLKILFTFHFQDVVLIFTAVKKAKVLWLITFHYNISHLFYVSLHHK